MQLLNIACKKWYENQRQGADKFPLVGSGPIRRRSHQTPVPSDDGPIRRRTEQRSDHQSLTAHTSNCLFPNVWPSWFHQMVSGGTSWPTSPTILVCLRRWPISACGIWVGELLQPELRSSLSHPHSICGCPHPTGVIRQSISYLNPHSVGVRIKLRYWLWKANYVTGCDNLILSRPAKSF